MRVRLALAMAAPAALALAGCGAGTPVSDHRAVATFHALEITGGVDVRVVRAAAPSVTVQAGDAVIDRVTTSASGGVLRVGVRDRGIVIGRDPLSDARVRVAMPALHDVTVSGSSDVELGGLTTRTLTLRITGTGDVDARGRVGRLDADITGPGDAHLAGLRARTARVAVQGPGDVDLSVADALDIRVDGPGDVTYRGNPRVTQDVNGPADITHIGP